MGIVSSYACEIKLNKKKKIRKSLDNTRFKFQCAVDYVVPLINESWGDILLVPVEDGQRKNYIDHLFHKTKDNPHPKYGEFDFLFHKMPSYFRRAVLSVAYGKVSSYKSNLANWEKDKQGNLPSLGTKFYAAPVFYKKNTYNRTAVKDENDKTKNHDRIEIKLLVDGKWEFVEIELKKSDYNYIQKYWTGKKELCPSLIKKDKKYYLVFSFEEKMELSETDIEDQVICSVDLGLNHDAVCSIMKSDGTILQRKFINFASDKDRLYKLLGRIKRFQRNNGSKYSCGLWRYAKALNKRLADEIAKAITLFASSYKCDVIVFEHLDMKGKKVKGNYKQKITLWRKNDIQKITEHKAHRLGIHISRICAWNTSKLAFDGSGEVERDSNNHSLCTFSNGKKYNCDLSASYNIGARYFIRELLKPVPAKEKSDILANVPECQRRTLCTLDSLKKLHAALAA